MPQIRYLILIFTSFCMGLSACAPTVDIPSASPAVTPKTTISPTPTTTTVPPTPTSELGMSAILQDEDTASSFVPMRQENFIHMFGSGGEENKSAIQEWVKNNWNLGEKDTVTLTGKNGHATIDRFDAETGKREVKFYNLITGEEGFDTNIAENYAGNKWESDPEWKPTQTSRVTVMGQVEGLNHPDGTPIEIPISIGAVQSSDIDRIVPSQYMADALAKAYLEAYKARYKMQTGTEVTWEEYLAMLKQGQGAPTVPQPNEDALSQYNRYTRDRQFNPLAGVAIVFADNRDKPSNLPVDLGPGLNIKNHLDKDGRLVIVLSTRAMSYEYNQAKLEARKSNAGKVTADEIFVSRITSWPALLINSIPDYCMRGSLPFKECIDAVGSDESRRFLNNMLELTVERRRQGVLIQNLLIDFQHVIPPYP